MGSIFYKGEDYSGKEVEISEGVGKFENPDDISAAGEYFNSYEDIDNSKKKILPLEFTLMLKD